MTLRKVNRYYLLVLSTYSTSHSFIRPDTSTRSNQIRYWVRKERKVLEEQACPALGRYLMIFADIEYEKSEKYGKDEMDAEQPASLSTYGLRHIQSTFGTESTLVPNSTDKTINWHYVISICYWANSRRDYFSTSTKDAWPWIDCDTNRNGKYGIRHMSDLCLCEMFLFRKLRKRFFQFS